MLSSFRLPKVFVWVFNLLIIFFLMFTLFRVITFAAFKPAGGLFSDTISSFLLGMRYDLRWISIILLPIVIGSFFPWLSPFYSERTKKIWTWYLAVVCFIVFFFFVADFGAFSYNNTRLNASALNFAEDPAISALMLWQSYPILWMVVGLLLSVLLLRQMFRKLHNHVSEKGYNRKWGNDRLWLSVTLLLLSVMTYGSVTQHPLKWKDAFQLNDSFRSYLALNPLQNFFTTLKFREPQFNSTEAKEYYPVMAKWMDLNDPNFSYKRVVMSRSGIAVKNPNVVLVLCESFSMYKSSMSGNALNTTPFFKTMSDSGVLFSRCFTPHFSTARGLFATITGIPDVQLSKFSTRNPEALDQHTIINDFKGYQKFYFLGGSPAFNNFEGLVKNIEGVQMITEGRFQAKPVNVWGISDKELFKEANDIFSKQSQPFFAIIQTADNHRPFTIPEEDKDFEKKIMAPEELNKWGFESLDEYNAFRYFDYCVEHFMDAAKRESYFDNTIFVFVGDHGVAGNARAVYPSVWTDERLTEEHVPLLFYAPKYLKPQKREGVVSQIDVLPTIAGLAGQTYINTTLGRDVLNADGKKEYAFTISHDEGRIGMITNDYFFTRNLNFQKEEIHFLHNSIPYSQKQIDSIKHTLSDVTIAFYETAKYMLMHNKKGL